MNVSRSSEFNVLVFAVILLLGIGILGHGRFTGLVVDATQALEKQAQKIQQDIQQAPKSLTATAQERYDSILRQAMQRLERNSASWAEKARPVACKTLVQSTQADTFVAVSLAQLEKSLQPVAQQILTETIKTNIVIAQNDPLAQQKIADAQAIANAGILPLIAYGAHKVLSAALKECPALEEPARLQRAVPAAMTRTTQFEQQPRQDSGAISGGGIGASPAVEQSAERTMVGSDIGLNYVEFYYDDVRDKRVDKEQLEYSHKLMPMISMKNTGDVAAKNIDIFVSVDGGVEEKKSHASLSAGANVGYGFFLPFPLSVGKHELKVRFEAESDRNLPNNLVVIPFTTIHDKGTDGAVGSVEFNYVNEYNTVVGKADKHAIDSLRRLFVTVEMKNAGRARIPEADVVLKVDGGAELKNKVWNTIGTTFSSFDLKGLSSGKHEIVARVDVPGDEAQNNNVVEVPITVLPKELVETSLQAQPAPVLSPTPLPVPTPRIDVGFKDAVFYYKRDPYTPIDKNALEQSYEKFIDVSVTNFGTVATETVDVYIREDDRNFEVKRFLASELQAGASKTRQFIDRDTMPSSLGSHKLVFRLETKGDTNPANDIGVVNFNIISTPEQQPQPSPTPTLTPAPIVVEEKLGDAVIELDLRGGPDGEKWLYQNKRVLPNELAPDKETEVYVRVRNAGIVDIQPKIIAEVDGKEVASIDSGVIKPRDFDKAVTLKIGKLSAGSHTLTVTAKVDRDKNPANNAITAELNVGQVQVSSPTPTPQPPATQGFDFAVDFDALNALKLTSGEKIEPSKIPENKQFIVTFDIKNTGSVFASIFYYSIVGKHKVEKGTGVMLQPGQSKTFQEVLPGLPAGTYTLEIGVKDDTGKQENNAKRMSLVVAQLGVTPTVTLPITPKPAPTSLPVDVALLPGSSVIFDHAEAVRRKANVIDVRVQYSMTANAPDTVPLFVTYSGVTHRSSLGKGVQEWRLQYVVSDRNKFPAYVHVYADSSDSNPSNNGLLIPVVIKKDGKLYLLK